MLKSPFDLEIEFNTTSFDFYEAMVDSFVNHISKIEGLSIGLDSKDDTVIAKKNFLNLPFEQQLAKIQIFKNFYQHCFELVSAGNSLRDNRKSLETFSFIFGLHYPCENEIYETFGDGVFAEIYDKNFAQIYRSPSWLETTSYGLKTLESSDWRKLFFRSEDVLNSQMQIVSGIYSGQIKLPVFHPIKVHTVKEVGPRSPYCCEIESLIYSPVFNLKGEFVGGLHLMKLHELRKLEFQVLSESSL